jgi:ABC-2 type transport system permease protein
MLISFRRVWAVMLRHLKPTFRDPIRYVDMIYWPLIDIFIWGFGTIWLQNSAGKGQGNAALILLTCLALWQIVFRCNIEIARNLLEEKWSQNLVNLFATPLKPSEWMLAVMGLGALQLVFGIPFSAVVIYGLYGINIFSMGPLFTLAVLGMLLTGWTAGFVSTGFILIAGKRAEMLAWSFVWASAPFIGVFYSIEVLPSFAQAFSWCLAPTYFFEATRTYLTSGNVRWDYFGIGFALSVAAFAASAIFFHRAFNWCKDRGLARLE